MAADRSHPLATAAFARFARNAIGWMWARGITERPRLEPDYLWAVGSKGYSREDEISVRSADEVDDFRQRLDRLCRSLREEAQLNALGHTMAYGQLVSAIRKRHRLGRYWRRNPEHAAASIAPPIVVVGQMRAGTTRVQRLLAADPVHAGTRFCNSHDPIPRSPDLRPVQARLGLALARRVNPWLDTLHPFGAARTDEEIGWLAAAFDACTYEAQWQIPSFVAFSESADPAPVYAEFARILRTDATSMGNAHKPRVLKCPQFAENLSALLEVFPDGRIVVTERDAQDVIASSASMVAAQSAFQSDTLDFAAIEAEWQRKYAFREKRMSEAINKLPDEPARVRFADLNRDWAAAMVQLYRSLGMELADAALDAMRKEVETSESDPHRMHGAQIRRFVRA